MSASRAPWFVAAVVAIAALPILGITAYLALGEVHGLAVAQSERHGLRQIARMNAALFDLSQLSRQVHCVGVAGTRLRALAARVDRDLASPVGVRPFDRDDWAAAGSAWHSLQPLGSQTSFDRPIEAIENAVVAVSDRSGLTFDAEIVTVDLSDALTYRLPQAADSLQTARRTLCGARHTLTLAQRLAVERANSRTQTLLGDAFQDLSDALAQRGMHDRTLAASFATVRRDTANASARVERNVAVAAPTDSHAALHAVDDAIFAMRALMRAEIPAIDERIGRRAADDRERITLAILQGVAGLVAAVLIALLLTRLLWQHAALAAAQRAAAENEHRAKHDPMTGLLNRHAFFGSGRGQGVLCIVDLDNLKQINDTFGHLTGDEVIVHVARTIAACVRSTDAVARLGGDEFAIFLRAPIERAAVERILAQILEAVRRPTDLRGHVIHTSVSAGATLVAESGTLEEAFAVADAALYHAKRTARGSVVYA